MTQKQKMAMAEKRVQKIYTDLKSEFPNIKFLGVSDEEKKIRIVVHSRMWLEALKQKPGKYNEADNFVRSIIIINSIMINKGIIDEHAELVKKH